ncbi:MAG: hypothetical protein JWL75_590 [Parcubacteria group bacterium]|nr:hypothetical protein [Parcubacteria group bacterium]
MAEHRDSTLNESDLVIAFKINEAFAKFVASNELDSAFKLTRIDISGGDPIFFVSGMVLYKGSMLRFGSQFYRDVDGVASPTTMRWQLELYTRGHRYFGTICPRHNQETCPWFRYRPHEDHGVVIVFEPANGVSKNFTEAIRAIAER